MYLERLVVENWCQTRHADVEFGDMTAIRGPNGAGKTNLVSAVVYALTGKKRGPGTNEERICQLAGPKEPATVRLFFRHGGAACEAFRDLRSPRKSYLKVGDEKIDKAPAIAAKLRQLLGVDEHLLAGHVFVPQWEMFSFISQTDEDRARSFARLFGTDRAEKIWKALGEVRLPDATLSVDGAAVRQRLADAEAALASADADKASLRAAELDLEGGGADRQRAIAAAAEVARLRAEAAAQEARVTALESEAARADGFHREEGAKADALAARLAETAAAAADAETALKSWDLYAAVAATRQRLQADLAAAEAELAARRVTPPPPVDYAEPRVRDQLRQLVALGEARRDEMQRLLASVDPARGVAACPTCGTPVTSAHLGARIEEARRDLPVVATRVAGMFCVVNASDAYDALEQMRLDGLATAGPRCEDLRRQLAGLGEPGVPALTPDEARRLAGERFHLARQHKDAEDLRQHWHREWLKSSSVAASHRQALEAALTRIAELGPAAADADLARIAEAALADLRARLAAAVCAGANARVVIGECAGLLRRHEEEAARAQRVRGVAAHLEEVRALYHRDRLPARVSQTYLRRMTDRVNEVLARFDRGFLVDRVEDLRFVLRFGDGRVVRDEQLSGGQQVLLALAVRPVLSLLFAPELGVLCLDEPTAGLDAGGTRCVTIALEHLRAYGRARGLQFLLITHDAGLDNLCDRVIDLSPESSSPPGG